VSKREKSMKKVIIKKALPIALSLAMALNMTAYTKVVKAEENEDAQYSLVWSEEFDGDSLNTDDWNVEEHEPGWVNSELQRYTSLDEGNIEVSDGSLKIYPHVTEAVENSEEEEVELTKTAVSFDITVPEDKATETAAIQINYGKIDDSDEGQAAATVVISDLSLKDTTEGEEDAELLKSPGFEKASDWSFGSTAPGEGKIEFGDGSATVTVTSAGEANWNVQLQQGGIALKAGHSYKFTLNAAASADRKVELTILDPDNGWYWYGGTTAIVPGQDFGGVKTGSSKREITSGRITTQGKHDFTYGRFETRAKVPYGRGFLPAFWLMATNESFYGQWPRCGEIDIMEVMGQNVNKSYHTIHYGYNSGNGHKENQGTKVLSEDNFADEYHVFRVDWEPGLISWYVDDEKVYETRDWYTGTDDDNQITYPAPFDQNFYIILNLAVGGSWVGYPDAADYEDMNGKSFEVDYVRVYQLPEEEIEKLENEAKKPEKPEVTYREADETGNYVINGDFAKDIAYEGADNDSDDNFKLHLESDCADTTYYINDANEITINPSAVGSQNYSVQLKQPGIPMYKGWEYELTFDAYAAAERDIVVDVEGPDRSWTRYLQDTNVTIGTEKATYTLDFTMNEKTDANGCLEFNLGKLDSTAAVTLSNIRLVHKSGEEQKEDNLKVVRPDGNYVYNGAFDQGDKRLGYWEFSEDDAQNISVVNAGGKRQLKVEVPEGKTVKIGQSELSPLTKGKYELSFDVKSEGGAAVKAVVSAAEFNVATDAEMKTFAKKFDVAESLDRKDSNISFEFSEAGTYYLDNVFLSEAALIKNGSFDAGLAGFSPYVYDTVKASYVVDSMNGNDNAFAITIEDTIADSVANEWYVQLNQDGITLEEGKTYRLSFKAKSSIVRNISYCMQEFEGSWTNYSNTGAVEIGPDGYKTFTAEFTMNHPTDTNTRFNITMGSVGGVRITEKHDVYIDDIVLEEVEKSEEPEDPTPVDPQPEDPQPEDPTPVDPQPEDPQPEDPQPEEPVVTAELVTKWGATYYVTEDGTKLTGFQDIDGDTYYFNEKTGAMSKEKFIEVDGESYYALKDGKIAKNCKLTKWGVDYLLDAEGKLLTGINSFNGNDYYSKANGAIVKQDWITIGEDKYFAKADGVLAKNEKISKWGVEYILGEDGKLLKGFATFEDAKYYCKDSGAVVKSSWITAGDDKYYAKKDGQLARSETVTIWGHKYTFDAEGKLIK
jgi:glucan-binding repeat-containing protein